MYDNHQPSLGEQIRNMVTDAVSSQNFEKLNNEIKGTVDKALEEAKSGIKRGTQEAVDSFSKMSANPVNQEQFRGGYNSRVKHKMPKWAAPVRKQKPEDLCTFPLDLKKAGNLPGNLMLGFGGTFTCILGFTALILSAIAIFSSSFPLSLPASFFTAAAGFGVLFAVGKNKKGRFQRMRNYLTVMGAKKFCSIEELAARTREKTKYVAKDLKKMISMGIFPDAHVTMDNAYFIGDYDTYKQYMAMVDSQKAQQLENGKDKKSDQEEDIVSEKEKEIRASVMEGRQFVLDIRNANDKIPGVEISKKLDRLQMVTDKIFQRVESRPNQLPQIRRFMEYYLPTTKKLVKAYEDFDAQTIQTENIQKSKKEIEDTLDTINVAFENLYASLFEDDVMDIKSDISVLQTMLAQEGLTGSDFDKKP